MSGWRPALRIARRRVRRSLGRSLLVAVLVAVPVAGATLVDVLARTLSADEREAQRIMGSADAEVAVTAWSALPDYTPVNGEGAAGAGKPDRDPTAVDVAALLPRGSRVVPQPVTLDVRLETAGRAARTLLTTADVRDPLLRHEGRVVEGRSPAGPDEAALSPGLAERLGLLDGDGALRTGATVRIHSGPEAAVTGLVRAPMCLSCERLVAAPDSALARSAAEAGGYWPGGNEDSAGYLVDLPEGIDADTLWRPLAAQGVAFVPRAAYTDPERYPGGGEQSVLTLESLRTAALVLLIAGLGLLEVVLLAGAAFAVGARRQTRELGLVSAAGGSARHVRRIVLAQGLVLGALGAVLGVAAGFAAAFAGESLWERLENGEINAWVFGPWEIAGAALIGVLSGLAAAIVPAIGAGRMLPVDALAERVRRSRAARRRSGALGAGLLTAGAASGLLGSRLLADDFAAYASALARVQEAGGYVSPPTPTGPVGLVLLGAALAVFGIVLVAPALIGALSRAGSRLPVAPRLAVRDAARHRHRTGPATSAVTVAVAGSVVLAFTLAGNVRADELRHLPALPPNVLSITPGDGDEATAAQGAERAAALLPDARTYKLRAPLRPLARGERLPAGLAEADARALYAIAPACSEGCGGASGPFVLASAGAGDAIAAGGRLDAAARRALAEDRIVVFDPGLLGNRGRVRIETGIDPASGDVREVRLPAHAAPRDGVYTNLPSALVPPAVARARGWEIADGAVLLTYAAAATAEQVDAAVAAAEYVGASALVERGPSTPDDALLLIAAGAAAFVTLVGVAISVALSAAEGRADLATLAAVGAPPRRRRALAAGQALLIAGLGCALGVALGAYIAYTARATTGSPDFVVPWGTLALTGLVVPLLAVLVTAVVTPSRLPLVRRAT